MTDRAFIGVVLTLALLATAANTSAQALPDPTAAKALDKCHIQIERAGAKLAVKKLKALAKCESGVLKCVETKQGDTGCLDQARERCEEQLDAAVGEEAKLTDTIVRKCGTDLTAGDLLAASGLDVESLRHECAERFVVDTSDLAGIGACLARQHACELERLFAMSAPRAASLLVVAGVDPARRGALTCLTDHGGADEHVADARNVGRPVERCGRAITNASAKLVDASLKATGKCLDTLFTCVEVKHDPASAPACLRKADQRCAIAFANLAAASARAAPALAKACGAVEFAVLASPTGLRLEALGDECQSLGAGAPTTLAAYADCLTRQHRCRVAELARFTSPRAEALLALVGRNLGATLCPSEHPATPTPAPTVTLTPSATSVTPTATPTPTALATPGPTGSPGPGCQDAYEPNAFPDTPASLNPLCPGGTCTDDGYALAVEATIDTDGDDDFYSLDVVDLADQDFQIQVRLEDIPDGTNYDLYLYRLGGGAPLLLDQSTHDGTGSETVEFDPHGIGDNSGTYGIEVRRVTGSSCDLYRLEIKDPS